MSQKLDKIFGLVPCPQGSVHTDFKVETLSYHS